MSGLINKAKDLLHSNKEESHHSSNLGPHDSNYANKADPRVDSDGDKRNNPSSGIGGHQAQHNYGPSGADPMHNQPGSTNAGPHSSNVANKLDPRIDSDQDRRADPTSRVGGYGSNDPTQYGQSTGGYGTTGHTGHSTNTGPHSSNLANKADPRIDSDGDGRADPTSRVGGYGSNDPTQYGGHSGGYDTTGRTGGYGTETSGGYGSGPHSSNLANKMDPRVDDNTGGYSSSQYGSGTTGTTGHHGQHGHAPVHDATTHGYGESGIGSGTTGGYGTSTSTGGSGTAGPHNSNLLNKLDPRVDSDADGSKTYGGNKTNY